MILQVEILKDGIMRVSDPVLHGKKIAVSIPEESKKIQETDWEGIKEIAKEVSKLDFTRRTHDEILRDLHELRG